jgi:hypothetical protein
MTYVVAVASVAGVIVAILAVVFALRGVRDQLWLLTFSEYTRRYSEIVRELPSEARRPGGTFAFAELHPCEQGRVLNVARAYFNLCSEEYYLHTRGRIDDATWEIWRDGMIEVLRAPWSRTTWELLKPEYRFLEFCEFFDDCVKAGSAHDDTRRGTNADDDRGSSAPFRSEPPTR